MFIYSQMQNAQFMEPVECKYDAKGITAPIEITLKADSPIEKEMIS